MPTLTMPQKRFIVERLACFHGLTEVARALLDLFGVEVERMHVNNYDGSKAYARRRMAPALLNLFDTTRQRFLEETAHIAISHRTSRLRALDRNERKAFEMDNLPLSNACLEQAAKEVGDYFTNRSKVDIDLNDVRAAEARALAKDLQHLTLEELEALEHDEMMKHFVKPGQS